MRTNRVCITCRNGIDLIVSFVGIASKTRFSFDAHVVAIYYTAVRDMCGCIGSSEFQAWVFLFFYFSNSESLRICRRLLRLRRHWSGSLTWKQNSNRKNFFSVLPEKHRNHQSFAKLRFSDIKGSDCRFFFSPRSLLLFLFAHVVNTIFVCSHRQSAPLDRFTGGDNVTQEVHQPPKFGGAERFENLSRNSKSFSKGHFGMYMYEAYFQWQCRDEILWWNIYAITAPNLP